MFKNQLQELAQKNCFNLPSYACIREGPDHAPRFKASVNFNGELYESPSYCLTLRQAEHAAAEVALNSLSRSGSSQALAAKIMDETGVCKNLLQETAQRAGVSLPVYTTTRSGPGHLPVFTCRVDLAGRCFEGESAKTKKQAEKNAAMTAWNALKIWVAAATVSEANEEQEQNNIARALASASNNRDEHSALSAYESSHALATTRLRTTRRNRDERGSATGSSSQTVPVSHVVSIPSPYPWASVSKDGVSSLRYHHAGSSHVLPHGNAISAPQVMQRAATVMPVKYVSQQQQPPGNLSRGIPPPGTNCSSSYTYSGEGRAPPVVIPAGGGGGGGGISSAPRQMLAINSRDGSKGAQVVTNPPPAHMEEHLRDEEEWLSGSTSSARTKNSNDDRSSKEDGGREESSGRGDHHKVSSGALYNQMVWGGEGRAWNCFPATMSMPYAPVRVDRITPRQVILVSRAPVMEDESTEGEAATRQVLSQLSL